MQNASPTVHFKTFGCQMNVYDSNRMLSLLEKEGYRASESLRDADVILINTCSIRDKSEGKVLSMLGQLRPLKEQFPNKVIGITGCVGQRIGRTLLQRVPHLDLVMGPDSVDRIAFLLNEIRAGGRRVLEAQLDTSGRTYSQPTVVHRARPSEFLTVMKGCDHFCTYCIVPFVRGREKSRSTPEILGDVRNFVARGTKEIVFLGQNINTYGKGTPDTLARLIEAAAKVEGLERIRYVTSHPRDLGDDLIQQFGTVEKLCPQLHLPFQSGSDAVLKRMSRLYTRDEYRRKIEALRSVRTDIALSTDVIVGFPGETEADFEDTLSMLREVRFEHVYLFKYSPRPGTRAFDYGEEVPESVKEERFRRAHPLTLQIIGEENAKRIGRIEQCLVESLDKKGLNYSGRTAHNRLTHILNAGPACVGKIIPVLVTEANGTNLKGNYTDAARHEAIPA